MQLWFSSNLGCISIFETDHKINNLICDKYTSEKNQDCAEPWEDKT